MNLCFIFIQQFLLKTIAVDKEGSSRNIALNQPAVQRSTLWGDSLASKAVDGNMSQLQVDNLFKDKPM